MTPETRRGCGMAIGRSSFPPACCVTGSPTAQVANHLRELRSPSWLSKCLPSLWQDNRRLTKRARTISMAALLSSLVSFSPIAAGMPFYSLGALPRAVAADVATPAVPSLTVVAKETVALKVANLPNRVCCLAVAKGTSDSIRKILTAVPGFIGSKVSFADKSVIVSFDPTVTSLAAIASALSARGYDVEIPSQ